ncbi:hypothetical protein GOP47_0007195 [Adiantum capillus-veneris]|uniref:histone acetyltransferase n=1 Tax=Adiantum capillus-veneris TaxID=13818 RepID=A0A9D4V078_ADICA|nr:hypothetical protein GOP47_0007195 [Adiantum capillus-veneris]
MDGPSGPNAPPGLAPSFAHSHSPTPSPSPSHSASASLSGSGQKRKRSDDHASSLGFPGNPNTAHLPHTFSNLHPNPHSHPSSISHESRDGPATSVDEDDDNGGTGGDESGMNHSQLDSISAGDPDGREEYEEEDDDDDDGNEDDAEQDDEDAEEEDEEGDEDDAMRTFTAARLEGSGAQRPSVTVKTEGLQTLANVKSEPVNESSKDAAVSSHSALVTPTSAAAAVVKEEPNKASAAETIQTSGAYCSREENFKREEDAGRLKFLCYSNDGVDQHMIWLIGLKNIFARQLPNMPKEYIVRLVMDRSHKSMMIIKNSQVVGGITYRPYVSQRFGEIAFLAITADEQVKGYGTRLMNHLKQHARDDDGLTHFLTYADNNAVGYFFKQGFTKEITMEKDRWQGYIKDYDGGTFMECQLDSKLPYIDLPALIRRQRQAMDEKIRELSNCHVVYSGIEIPKKEAGIPRRPLRIEDIPGLKDAGWVPEQWGVNSRIRLVNSTQDGPPTRQALHAFMRILLKAVVEHADAWPFKDPVDPREVPDYYDIIKDPIDLKTISKRLESEMYYLTLDMFSADMKRMFANARTYNSPDTIYFKCANRLEVFFSNKLQAGIQTVNR